MKLRDFEKPKRVEEALLRLKELGEEGIAIAGGTALHFMPAMGNKVAVDISQLDLDGIEESDKSYLIGSTTSIADLLEHDGPAFVLREVAKGLATNQIRNMSTIGGNVSRVFPWSDFPVALLALDGSFEILPSQGEKLGADDFFAGQPAKKLQSGRLLSKIEVHKLEANEGFAYKKEVRSFGGFSFVTAAARLSMEGGRILNPRVAIGAAVGLPRRLVEVEKLLSGKNGDKKTIQGAIKEGCKELKLRCQEGQSVEYTAGLLRVVVADVLDEAMDQAQKGDSSEC